MAITNLTDQLKRDEGLRLTPYRDQVDKLTIGYGRNLDAEGINESEAEFMLSNDIAKAATLLAKALPWTGQLDEVRRGALINMVFNMGIGSGSDSHGLLSFHRTLAMIQAGNYSGAAEAMRESGWHRQVGDRAERLAKQIETGEWQ